jgi:hypothetical protein
LAPFEGEIFGKKLVPFEGEIFGWKLVPFAGRIEYKRIRIKKIRKDESKTRF